jgi:uncharacterized protein
VSEADPVSPCTAVCALDPERGLCRGCYRTLAEIAAWPTLGATERRRILVALVARRAAET